MGLERWVGVFVGLAVGAFLLFHLYGSGRLDFSDVRAWFGGKDESLAAPIATPAPAPLPVEEQVPRYPVPAQAGIPDAPETPADLGAIDTALRAEAGRVLGGAVEAFLVRERIVQSIVATVDSLDREPVPIRFRAIREVPGQPVVVTREDAYHLSSDNDERYRLLGDALRIADGGTAARLYLRWYPLFQRAYREMGYPGAHFNDRVVAVIDHLLAAPEVSYPVELVRPKVLYEFADPRLERLSSGHKVMIRIGPANAQAAKSWLREVRAAITAAASPAGNQGAGEPNGISSPSPAPAEPSRGSAGSTRGQL